MSGVPPRALEALSDVYDPCCREKGIPVVDMGFMTFQIPEDLCAGYGYPQLTDQAERKILGENLLRPHGMDVEETMTRLGRRAG
jgi:hypothetical protein